jgi:hypothetical protein
VEEEEEREETIENKHYLTSYDTQDNNTFFPPSHVFMPKTKHNSKMVNSSYLLKLENHQPLLQTPSSFSDINSSSVSYYYDNNSSNTFSINHSLESRTGKSSHLIPLMTKCDQEVFMSQNLFEQQRKHRFKGNFSSSKQLINFYEDNSHLDQISFENEKESSSMTSFITTVPNNQIFSSIVTPNGSKSKNGLYIYNKLIILLLFLIF